MVQLLHTLKVFNFIGCGVSKRLQARVGNREFFKMYYRNSRQFVDSLIDRKTAPAETKAEIDNLYAKKSLGWGQIAKVAETVASYPKQNSRAEA